MYTPEKHYNLNAADELDLVSRQKHEEEMKKAFERLENKKRIKKKTLYCGIAGFAVGVLYIAYIAMGIEWIDALIGEIAGESGILRFIMDFLPPILISGIAAYFIARGEKRIGVYILSSISVFLVVTLVFLVYVSLMIS